MGKKGFDKFLIVTTPVLDGVEVQEYLGPVVVRSVRAVNIVRDFFTVFRDIFGGRSGAYQEVVDDMFRDIMTEMRQRAEQMGATAVIGFRIDFESIGAKRTSLVMAVAQGTAVRI
ncbi:MAG: YbjQ family protein [Planctomycetota bacterium]|jgi:uncharacterized protein YbjQ (UPF0145 family)